jgi:hypothetical protein
MEVMKALSQPLDLGSMGSPAKVSATCQQYAQNAHASLPAGYGAGQAAKVSQALEPMPGQK